MKPATALAILYEKQELYQTALGRLLYDFVNSHIYLLFLYQPLPPQEEKELQETIQDIFGQGKKVTIEQKVCSIKLVFTIYAPLYNGLLDIILNFFHNARLIPVFGVG